MSMLPCNNLQHGGVWTGGARPDIVANDFGSKVVSSHAASPMHAPNVASRFNLLRRVAEYKARTKRQKERHVPKQVGSSNNQEARRQKIRNIQTSSKSGPKTAKNAPFAGVSPGVKRCL